MKTRYWYWIWKTFLGPSRLRRKFVRTFLLAGLIPLLFMGIVSLYLIDLTHSIDIQNLEKNIARQVSTEVKKVMDEIISTIELRVAFNEFAPISFSQQDFILESILRDKISLFELSFVCLTPKQCAFGKETSRWRAQGEKIEKNQELRDLSREDSFQKARAGQNYLGPVEFNETGLEVTLASPIYNVKSEMISVIVGRVNLNSIQAVVKNAKLGETGYVYLIDNDGRVIAHPDQALVRANAKELPPVLRALSSEPEKTDPEPPVYENLKSERVSGASEFIEKLNWAVIAEWPRDETERLIETINTQFILFLLFTLIVITVVASWVAFRLIQPIAQLRQGTSVIGGGNFNYRVNIKTGDELEDLGNNLNRMAENLKGLEEVHELRIKTEALSESLRKEQELSKTKDQFITTVSHQLNTPLSIIRWALSELNDPSIKSRKVRDSAKIINQSEQDIISIVNDLVTLSEVGVKYEKTRAKQVNMSELIKSSIQTFSEAINLKNINYTFNPAVSDPIAEVNEFMMKKAIENLVDNAISYSHDGGKIEIELGGDEENLTFKITDHGIGIPKEDKESIFSQFFRAKNAIAKKNVGTGLGLFISKNIVEGHHGKITFSSEENKGSTFTVTLPRK